MARTTTVDEEAAILAAKIKADPDSWDLEQCRATARRRDPVEAGSGTEKGNIMVNLELTNEEASFLRENLDCTAEEIEQERKHTQNVMGSILYRNYLNNCQRYAIDISDKLLKAECVTVPQNLELN